MGLVCSREVLPQSGTMSKEVPLPARPKTEALRTPTEPSQREVSELKNTAISTVDLRALLDVAEGYTAEHGLDAVGRYAVREAVQRAINNATVVVRESGDKLIEVKS